MIWISFKQEGMEPLLHGRLMSITSDNIQVRCKNDSIRFPKFNDIKIVYETKQECYADKENNGWKRGYGKSNSVQIYQFLSKLLALDSCLDYIIDFPRNTVNDAGMSLAENIISLEISKEIRNQQVFQLADDNIEFIVNKTDDFRKYFHEGDYVEGAECYGPVIQRMRGTVIRVFKDYIDIRCDDWYDGYRANTVSISDNHGIIKFKKETPRWWVGEKLLIKESDNASYWRPKQSFPLAYPLEGYNCERVQLDQMTAFAKLHSDDLPKPSLKDLFRKCQKDE